MNHCEFCDLNLDDDIRFCPKCKGYKGIVPGPMWEDNRDRAEYCLCSPAAAAQEVAPTVERDTGEEGK